MAELKSYTCPNCGANTTNADNCEYCGSLLVRFVEKGIDLSKTTYLNDDSTFLGLTNALKHNLQLQKDTDESVVTDIIGIKGDDLDRSYLACILRNGKASYLDGQNMPTKSTQGLCVSFAFHHAIKGSKNNALEAKRLDCFKSLDCFPLFTEHISYYNENEWKSNEYFIDFGKDAEGASRLISRILQEVYELPIDRKIDCYTNAGHDNVVKCREGIDAEIEAEVSRRRMRARAEARKKLAEKSPQLLQSKKPTSQLESFLKDPWSWGYIIIILFLILLCLFGW